MISHRISLVACITLVFGVGMPSAHATVDAMLFSNIVYAHPQLEGYCYARVPVSAEIGIPPAALTEGSLAPSYALRSSSGGPFAGELVIDGSRYVNINALAAGATIQHTYINDSYTSAGTVEYTAELDLSQVDAANGQTVEGRQATVTRAKLALLALAKNLKDDVGSYRLFVTFKGLPDQSGLSGQPVYASSKWPYTGASPVLAAYEKELIDSTCNSGSALYGKTDGTSPITAEAASAGCAVGAGAGTGLAGLAVVLLALVALGLRRRR